MRKLLTTVFVGFGLFTSPLRATAQTCDARALDVASFNVQFLGNSSDRDNEGLAFLVKDHDIVVVQELVAPPYAGLYPGGAPFKPDEDATKFFDAMAAHGFNYVLSPENTGSGDRNRVNGSAAEWWVTFYKPARVAPAADLPNGFLADDVTNHPNYERVPYAFGFRSCSGTLDFVLISVHLQPGGGRRETARRAEELSTIGAWIAANDNGEQDFIILGDMNIEDSEELIAATPDGFLSLNDECASTNTNTNGPKPYDHVMYRTEHTADEIDRDFDFKVIDMVAAMEERWAELHTSAYPGNPYNHNGFRRYFSDHNPVSFRMIVPVHDDD